VELGKELAMRILPAIEGGEVPPLDGSTSVHMHVNISSIFR
jgi:hypothetical protein